MKRLFNAYSAQNPLGNGITDRTEEFIFNLLEQYSDVDLNDLETVVTRTINVCMAEKRLVFATHRRKIEERVRNNVQQTKESIENNLNVY